MNLKQMFHASAPAVPPVAVAEKPQYPFPEGFIERLRQDLEEAGTGLADAVGVQVGFESPRLSSFLLAHGVHFFALEADEECRRAASRLCSSWPSFQLFPGAPDATGLDAGSVDFVLSDRALYWPNQDGVRAEFTRILRPGGVVALVTDNRVYTGGEQAQAFEDLLRTHCPGFREKRETFDIGGAVAALFADGRVFEDAFTGTHTLTLEEFLAQTACMPVYPATDDPAHVALGVALRHYFHRWAKKGKLTVPTVCRVAFGRMTR